jgi:hypothetical protein
MARMSAEGALRRRKPAKTTLFAGDNEADVRKMATGHFSNKL